MQREILSIEIQKILQDTINKIRYIDDRKPIEDMDQNQNENENEEEGEGEGPQ